MSDCYGNTHQIHPKYKTQQWRRRPFNTVNVRQCSMICEKDEIVFSSFTVSLSNRYVCSSALSYQQLCFYLLRKSLTNTPTRAEPLLFFDDTIKTIGPESSQKNTRRRNCCVKLLGDFKVFSLRQEEFSSF